MTSLVCGAGGMIGGALVEKLVASGEEVYAVDIKEFDDWYRYSDQAYSCVLDLSDTQNCLDVVSDSQPNDVYMLAADMGGIGFIEHHKLDCMMSVLISAGMLKAALDGEVVSRYLHSSSACVYSASTQNSTDLPALTEDMAYPAEPEPGYGEEKLFSESLVLQAGRESDMLTYAPRLHNVYSTHCTWDGGREKAPAAICRKVAEAVLSGRHEIDIWGDGNQTRSFMWIDDCLEGFERIINSDYHGPLNLGSSELVTVNELVSIVEDIAGVTLERTYDLSAPIGVMGRNSDNTLIQEKLDGWEPSTPLRTGLERLYGWVYKQVEQRT